jgi:protein SCO1/2
MQTDNPAGMKPAPHTVPPAGGAAPTRPPQGFGFRLAWTVFILAIVGVLAAAIVQRTRGPAEKWPEPGVYGTVPDFSLTAQDGTTVSRASLAGQPWVVDFIFTRCGGQCPTMTRHMKALQTWLEQHQLDTVRLVSVTVDPDYDTPAVFTEYAKRFGADTRRWSFLSGDKKTIYPLIQDGFYLGVDDEPAPGEATPEEPIVHSSRFVLVDAQSRIRGYYDVYEADDLDRLRSDLRHILAEKP